MSNMITLGELRDYWKEAAIPDIEMVDLEAKIRAINPKYLNATYTGNNEYKARISELRFCPTEGRVYLLLSTCHLFYTEDDFITLKEVPEINYFGGDVIKQSDQMITSIIESMDKTVVVVGTDKREVTQKGIYWRKPRNGTSFNRGTTTAWNFAAPITKLTAGFFGQDRVKMLAFVAYGGTNAFVHYSLDDGVTWRGHDFASHVAIHLHEVYLSDKVFFSHPGRLWITCGDDFSNIKGGNGIMCVETLNADNSLGTPKYVFAERPGYRIVGVAGNGRKTYFGNEASACGMLAISEDSWSVNNKQWEYVMGRHRFDFHQFNSICATEDGYVISGTDGYELYDTPHKGQGGVIYISKNEGATFVEIPLGAWWVNSIAYDGKHFWAAIGARPHGTSDISINRFAIMRIKKPSIFADLFTPYIAKSIYVDNGNAITPLSLVANEKSMIVDMSAYKTIVLDIETHGAGSVKVEASPFWTDPNWLSQGDIVGWREIATINFASAERKEVLLSEIQSHNKIYRIKNGSDTTSLGIKHAVFIGKK